MNHYDILEVSPDASPEQIKRAYRKKAKASHPDLGGDPAEFKRLILAYETLGDAAKRKRYDTTGQDASSLQSAEERLAVRAVMNHILDDGDPIEIARKEIEGNKKACDADIKQLARSIAKIKKRLEKIKKENSKTKNPAGLAILVQAIEQQICSSEANRKEGQNMSAILDGALCVLEGLRCPGEGVISSWLVVAAGFDEAAFHKMAGQGTENAEKQPKNKSK